MVLREEDRYVVCERQGEKITSLKLQLLLDIKL